MSYENQLVTDINARLDELAVKGQPWQAKWIAHAICNEHKACLAEDDHADFWLHCGYKETRDLVRRCISKRAGDKEECAEQQYVMDGFERLQPYYMVKRDGEEIGVPINDMTDAELSEKALAYRGMASGCWLHAQELDRYREARSAHTAPTLFSAASPQHV